MADPTATTVALGPVALGPGEIALAATLVLAAGAVSVALRLGLEKKLALAACRTVLQLLLVGYLLGWIFRADTPLMVVAAFIVMTLVAGRAAVRRSSRFFVGVYPRVFLSLLLCGVVTTLVATEFIIGVQPWYAPRYLIPLLGMVFGNSLTGISLCLDTLLEAFDDDREHIEMALALGATAWEAARDSLRAAARRGLIPIINAMSVAGIVALPGMMTGQILAGAEPLQAVAYQIVVLFMISAATALGCIFTAVWAFRRLFNARHQLLVERIKRRAN